MTKKIVLIALFSVILSGCSLFKTEQKQEEIVDKPQSEKTVENQNEETEESISTFIYDPASFDEGKFEEIKEEKDEKPISTVVFDGCGKAETYQNESWFDDFNAELANFNTISEKTAIKSYEVNKDLFDSPEDLIAKQGKPLSTDKIHELCYSEEENLVIATYPGAYCSNGEVYKYQIDKNKLEKADHLSEFNICSSNFWEFGKRNGDIIPVMAGSGDAGCGWETDYNYNYKENTLKLVKECWTCFGAGDEVEIKCTDY